VQPHPGLASPPPPPSPPPVAPPAAPPAPPPAPPPPPPPPPASGVTQTQFSHASPGAQSATVEQPVWHAVVPQAYAPHGVAAGATQAPAPSHLLAPVAWPLAHDGGAQVVDVPAKVQLVVVLPLQVPFQVPVPAQGVRAPCGGPLTATQEPWLPPTSHASQMPAQAVVQHTPSTQYPLWH
jgi:hypothetical protein